MNREAKTKIIVKSLRSDKGKCRRKMEPRKVEVPAPLHFLMNFVLTYFLHYTYRSLKNTIQYIINLRVYCTVYSVRLRTLNFYSVTWERRPYSPCHRPPWSRVRPRISPHPPRTSKLIFFNADWRSIVIGSLGKLNTKKCAF